MPCSSGGSIAAAGAAARRNFIITHICMKLAATSMMPTIIMMATAEKNVSCFTEIVSVSAVDTGVSEAVRVVEIVGVSVLEILVVIEGHIHVFVGHSVIVGDRVVVGGSVLFGDLVIVGISFIIVVEGLGPHVGPS